MDTERRDERECEEMVAYEKQSQPFFLTRWINRMHFIIVGLTILIVIFCLFSVMAKKLLKGTAGHAYTSMAKDHKKAKEFLAVYQTDVEVDEDNRLEDTPKQSQDILDWTMLIMFKYTKGNNIFTPENIPKLQKLQEEFESLENYGNLCLLIPVENGEKCFAASPLGFYANATTQEHIDKVTSDLVLNPQTAFFLSSDASTANPKSKYTRDIYKFGAPIEWKGEKYRDKMDDLDEQNRIYNEELSMKVYEWGEDTLGEDIEVYPISKKMLLYKVLEVLGQEVKWVLLSLIIICIYQWVHFESSFLAAAAVLQYIAVVTPSMLIFKLIYAFPRFGPCELMVTFLFPGITTDCLFYLKDTFTHTKAYSNMRYNMDKRMTATWKRTIGPITLTHMTIGIGMVSIMWTPLMPILRAAIFATTMLVFNYIFTILYFPAVLSIHEQFIKYAVCTKYHFYKHLCYFMCGRKVDEMVKDAEYLRNIESNNPSPTKRTLSRENSADPLNRRTNLVGHMGEYDPMYEFTGNTIVERYSGFGWLDKLFQNQITHFLDYIKYWIFGIMLLWIGYNMHRSMDINPRVLGVVFFREGHYAATALDMRDEFTKGPLDDYVDIHLVWGIEGLDQEDNNFWDSNDIGTLIYDKEFDIIKDNLEQKQLRFIEICEQVRQNSLVKAEEGAVICPINQLKEYVLSENLTFPLPAEDFFPTLIKFAESTKNPLIKIGKDSSGNKILKMLKIKATATMIKNADDIELYKSAYSKWENLRYNLNERSDLGMNKMIEVAFQWGMLNNPGEYMRIARRGVVIIPLTALILEVILTCNLLISLFVFLCSMGCIVCVYGFMNAWGFTISNTECITLYCLYWFFVSFPIRLGYEYTNSKFNTRFYRMQEALKHSGITVFGANFAMILGSFPFYMATLIFLADTGKMTTCSQLYALFSNLFFFPAICFAVGPNKETGNLKALCNRCRRKKSEEERYQKPAVAEGGRKKPKSPGKSKFAQA